MTQLITELINHEAVYRTAPATPGLLIRTQLCENKDPKGTHYLVKLRPNRNPLRKKKGTIKLFI